MSSVIYKFDHKSITQIEINSRQTIVTPLHNVNWQNLFRHSFHLVKASCLPFVTGLSAFLLVSSVVFYWNPSQGGKTTEFVDSLVFHLAVVMFFSVIISWLIMVVYESGTGYHTAIVRRGLRLGVVLFIVSEIMFFFSLFWAFFHNALDPSFVLGHVWPPTGTKLVDIWSLPLVNTILLLSSGVTITAAHHYIRAINNPENVKKFLIYLGATIILGLTFLACQWIEYTYGVVYRWSDNVYGDIFFLTTGFHGFHVLLGTYGLLFCFVRTLLTTPIKLTGSKLIEPKQSAYFFIKTTHGYITNAEKFGFSSNHHVGFEAALWYWHFVDVVWIFLFSTIYWWSVPVTLAT